MWARERPDVVFDTVWPSCSHTSTFRNIHNNDVRGPQSSPTLFSEAQLAHVMHDFDENHECAPPQKCSVRALFFSHQPRHFKWRRQGGHFPHSMPASLYTPRSIQFDNAVVCFNGFLIIWKLPLSVSPAFFSAYQKRNTSQCFLLNFVVWGISELIRFLRNCSNAT